MYNIYGEHNYSKSCDHGNSGGTKYPKRINRGLNR